jgi:hypothetical protein
MFVDLCGHTRAITVAETGQSGRRSVFVSALAASGSMYIEAAGSQERASWLSPRYCAGVLRHRATHCV